MFPSNNSDTITLIIKDAVSSDTLIGIQIKRNKPCKNSKLNGIILEIINICVELKLSWIRQIFNESATENRLSTFVKMEGALITEKTYCNFVNSCKVWLPKVCAFFYAFIMFYEPNGNFYIILERKLIGYNNEGINGSYFSFPLTMGLTSIALKKNEPIVGTPLMKDFYVNLDNFMNYDKVMNFLFLPLNDKKGNKLGVIQLYNCQKGEINEDVIVF